MIRLAAADDAHLVHHCMIRAFEEYRYADIPSSALDEAVNSIEESFRSGMEQALVYVEDGIPWGSVRFKTDADSLYFFRLSVCPEARGRGIAKSMLAWLENMAREQEKTKLWCRVRMSVPQNILLYQSMGYQVHKEEVVINPNGFPVRTVLMQKEIS
ncbi:GNAT family N-acetyltransferase [Paenibacillus spongiae]|uniref:GNAT family N-acetyltransferase n=1 Tax=Paenibacillus spongiae TaxID=2909671 RepID=A0ABY5S6B4_9BACL|nr:GNAT family N-acetyltransferase [Paenibacillus spongiae]UVI29451.1 GNAT family N-acetyltransferase [Paenibacillus spongiae]